MIAKSAQYGLRLPSLYTGLIAAVALICCLVVGLDGWHTWEARKITVAADEVETANLLRSLAQHAHDTMEAADAVVADIRESVETDGVAPERMERLRRRMIQDTKTLPMIHGLFVYDRNGDRIVNSLPMTSLPMTRKAPNNTDRAYFLYHQSHPERGAIIGNPIRSKADGGWVIPLSRRIDAQNGSFDGVALATISVSGLQQFYATFDIGPLGAITMTSASGITLVREPYADAYIGTDISNSVVFRDLLPHSRVGSFEANYVSDGLRRLGNYRRVEGYPLVIIVAHGLDDALAAWRKDARLHAGISIGAALSLALVGWRFAEQVRRTQTAERGYRLLADNSSDAIVCVGLGGERLYASPAFTTLTGWSIREGREQPWGNFVHPDDQPRVMDIETDLQAGAGPVACHLRYACKDGRYRWAEARVQRLEGADGGKAQYVANIRDITARKIAEDEVAALNQELALQAVTDGLTGLANRRRFNEALELEWRRAAREGKPLSLLMIDVDRFKLYNDRYGHPRGDRCLQAVATVIASFARRAGDVAARYGGEEFATLLPGSDETGAAAMGEALRGAIEALGLEHAGSLPNGIVTVSIGVATIRPGTNADSGRSEDIVLNADAALYQAKRAGRNRVASFETLMAAAGDAAPPDPAPSLQR